LPPAPRGEEVERKLCGKYKLKEILVEEEGRKSKFLVNFPLGREKNVLRVVMLIIPALSFFKKL
jgi:hypothetical protein